MLHWLNSKQCISTLSIRQLVGSTACVRGHKGQEMCFTIYLYIRYCSKAISYVELYVSNTAKSKNKSLPIDRRKKYETTTLTVNLLSYIKAAIINVPKICM